MWTARAPISRPREDDLFRRAGYEFDYCGVVQTVLSGVMNIRETCGGCIDECCVEQSEARPGRRLQAIVLDRR